MNRRWSWLVGIRLCIRPGSCLLLKKLLFPVLINQVTNKSLYYINVQYTGYSSYSSYLQANCILIYFIANNFLSLHSTLSGAEDILQTIQLLQGSNN